MSACLIVAFVMAAAGPEAAPLASPEDLKAYEAASASAGRDPDAQVRLALWCEQHGLLAERAKHLALAVLADPSHAKARGLLGLVAYRGRWQRPEAVLKEAVDDAALAEYNARRAGMKDTVDAHWKLALWCEQKGLKAEATAHLATVIRLDPAREAAWKRLGFKKPGGRWVSDAQLSEAKAEAERQKQADRRWKPLLETWRARLGNKARRAEAEEALARVTDPRAAPMVWAVFAGGGAGLQAVAVRLLGQIDAAGASRGLALLAVSGKSAEVRRAALETLKRRDPREYAGVLIAMLRDPIKYHATPVRGPGMPGTLLVEGERQNVRTQYAPPAPPVLARPFSPTTLDLMTYDANGLPVIVRNSGVTGYIGPDGYALFGESAAFAPTSLPQPQADLGRQILQDPGHAAAIVAAHQGTGPPNPNNLMPLAAQAMANGFTRGAPGIGNTVLIGQAMLETQRAAAETQQQLEADVQSLERYNAEVGRVNEQVGQVLNEATGQDLAAARDPWQRWWEDQFGFARRAYDKPKATIERVVSPDLPPVAGFENTGQGYINRTSTSCFGAGTPVWTLAGPRPIESLAVGDRVLTLDTKTGALGYQPVLVVHRNPPSPTFRIALAGDAIVSSHFHRFWKAGKGWVMARDLKSGDTLRTRDGLARVEAIEPGEVQPVFNLDIARDADFFVGRAGALAHDNSLPELRMAPFDAEPNPTTPGGE